jgi:signal peptidase I
MTVQEPQELETFQSAGPPHEGAEPEPEVVQAGVRPRVSGAPAPARRSDYRLRGLDLEAHGLAEVQPRLVRKAHPSRRRRRRRLVIQWAVALTLVAATTVLLRDSVVRPYSVRSTSMVPTLQPGTDVLVLRPRLLTGPIKVGDIVVFRRPHGFSCSAAGDSSQYLVKRVIGLPGASIWSAGERIYVNGRPLEESGWYNPPFGELGPTQIARTPIRSGTYFVMGDNRTDPCDSRSFGPISGSSLVGKVVATTTRDGHPFVHFF